MIRSLLEEKTLQLKAILADCGSVLVAFSGGVDSTFLLKVAADTLHEHAVAFTEASPLHQSWELAEARELALQIGVRHLVIEADELEHADFSANPPNRCYLCKSVLYGEAQQTALDMGLNQIVEGSTVDDLNDYRPGRQALTELGIRSPLLEAGFTKSEIREASRSLGLPTWNKQPLACLASRFPYGTKITRDRLRQVEQCETFLRDQGIQTFRVRYHDKLARIEVSEPDILTLSRSPLREETVSFFKAAGFIYVALDLAGFRSGSMNESLTQGGI